VTSSVAVFEAMGDKAPCLWVYEALEQDLSTIDKCQRRHLIPHPRN